MQHTSLRGAVMSRDFNLFPDGAFGADYFAPTCAWCGKAIQVRVVQTFHHTDIRHGVDYYHIGCMKERMEHLSNHSTTTEANQ